MARRKWQRVSPTDDLEQLAPLCVWPERSAETGTPERTLYRRIAVFRNERYGYQLGEEQEWADE